MSRIASLGLAAVALCASVLPAAAQDQRPTVRNGQTFGAWTVSCEALGMDQTVCALTQRITRSSDGAFLAELLAFPGQDGARMLAARVPVGVYLPNGFVMGARSGDSEQRNFTWQACSAQVCEALTQLSPEEASALEGTEDLVVGYRPRLGTEPLLFPVRVEGLSEGLDALGRRAPAE